MKKLVTLLVLVLVFASCKSTNGINNVDYKFNENVLYYKGKEIGHIEAMKFQLKNRELRREVVLLMDNKTEEYNNQAREIIEYMAFHIKNSDIEVKYNVEKK